MKKGAKTFRLRKCSWPGKLDSQAPRQPSVLQGTSEQLFALPGCRAGGKAARLGGEETESVTTKEI